MDWSPFWRLRGRERLASFKAVRYSLWTDLIQIFYLEAPAVISTFIGSPSNCPQLPTSLPNTIHSLHRIDLVLLLILVGSELVSLALGLSFPFIKDGHRGVFRPLKYYIQNSWGLWMRFFSHLCKTSEDPVSLLLSLYILYFILVSIKF